MLVFSIYNEDSSCKATIKVPSEAKDVSLKTVIELIGIERNAPLFFKDILAAKTDEDKIRLSQRELTPEQEKEWLFYQLQFLEKICTYVYENEEFLPTITELVNENKCNINDVRTMYNIASKSILNYEYKDVNTVPIFLENGFIEIWHLPIDVMKGNTLIEFLEAAQFKHYTRKLGKGHYDCLPKIMSIILRPQGEKYDEVVSESRIELMGKQNFELAMQVGFFFRKLNNIYAKTLTMFSETERIALYKQARQNKLMTTSAGT